MMWSSAFVELPISLSVSSNQSCYFPLTSLINEAFIFFLLFIPFCDIRCKLFLETETASKILNITNTLATVLVDENTFLLFDVNIY